MAMGTRWSRVMVETPGVLLLFALILVGCAQAGPSGGGNDDPGSTPPDFSNPFPVAGVTEGVGGFDELNGARGITTVTVGSSVYALVASQFDDGVQIIDITNPESPLPTARIRDGDDSFDTLAGAYGITTVTVGSSVYALVTSISDNGVQIIDITFPASPNPAATVTDGGFFDELNTAYGITKVTVGSSTYALVASYFDDGVQIIEVTNPGNPLPTGSVTDGVDGFDVLQGAAGVTAVTVGSSVYALVASELDDGVQIIDITDPANPQPTASVTDGDDSFDTLAGAFGITTVTIGTSVYALVASFSDDGVQIIDITDPTSPQPTASVTDGVGGFDTLDGATGITAVTIGPSVYALVASQIDDGVQVLDITNPASPQPVASVADGVGGFDELAGAFGITTVTIGSSVYALVSSTDDDGVQIIGF